YLLTMHRWAHATPAEKPSGRVSNRRLTRQVMGLFRPHRRQVYLAVGLIVCTSGLGVVNPILIKFVFDALFPRAGGGPDMRLVGIYAGLMILIPVITGTVGIAQTYQINSIGQRLMEDLRNSLYGPLQALSMRFFTSTRTGEIQSRFTNDVGGIQSVVTDTASSIVSNVVVITSTLVAMLVLSWQLTAVFLFLTYRAGNTRRKVTLLAQESKAEMSAITQETLSISGILLGKTFGRQR